MEASEKQRVSVHKGKTTSANHNVHFDELGDDVIYAKTFDLGDEFKNVTPQDYEIEVYERLFGEWLQNQNQKYFDKRNYGRMKSMEQVYKSAKKCPTEEILQYGNVKSTILPDKKTFWKMVCNYYNRLIEMYPDNLVVLDVAGHFDESTPHSQSRYIWKYNTEAGYSTIEQEKAMEQAGIELPDPEKLKKDLEKAEKLKPDKADYDDKDEYEQADKKYKNAVAAAHRYNNRSITFTNICRSLWQDICEEYGFEVEREVIPNGRKKHLTVQEYRAMEHEETMRTAFEELNSKETALNDREQILNQHEDDLKERENEVKELEEKLDWVSNEIDKDKQSIEEDKKANKEYGMRLSRKGKSLDDRERALDDREKALDDREGEIALKEQKAQNKLNKAVVMLARCKTMLEDLEALAEKYPDLPDKVTVYREEYEALNKVLKISEDRYGSTGRQVSESRSLGS